MFTDGSRFYLDYIHQVGPADAELDRNPRAALRGIFDVFRFGYEVGDVDRRPIVPPGHGLLDAWRDPGSLPPWLPEQSFETLVASYEEYGFTASLGFCRDLDRTWELTAAFDGVRLAMPSLFLLGERDVIRSVVDDPRFADDLPKNHPGFRGTVVIAGAGHWANQEQPQAVTDAVLAFIRDLH